MTAKILFLSDDSYLITFSVLCTPRFAHSVTLTYGQQPNRRFGETSEESSQFLVSVAVCSDYCAILSESNDDTSRTDCAGEIR